MNLQNGGSLDVVCSSERKKSGSTLRHHQHPGRGKAVGGHRAPSLCPSEAAKPRLGYKHSFISLSRLAVSHNQNREVSQLELRSLTMGTAKSHNGNREVSQWELRSLTIGSGQRNSSLTNGSGQRNSSLTNGSGRTKVSQTVVAKGTQVSQTVVAKGTQVSQTVVVELKSHKR